jgi:methyl-accepting chemotaxis protein
LSKSISTIFIIIILCNVSVSRLSHAGQDDIGTVKNIDDKHMKCLQVVAETTIEMLIASRNVIAKNQELINTDPATGNYFMKGFVPAVVGSQIANDFSLMTGYKLKQTSLKVRNPSNSPDEWERKALKLLESSEHPKGVGFYEMMEVDGKKSFRFMRPIYVDAGCLQCHGKKRELRPVIRQFLVNKYPFDQAFGYKEGELRGGISITISPELLGIEK